MNQHQRQLQRGAEREQKFHRGVRFVIVGGVVLLFTIAVVFVMVVG